MLVPPHPQQRPVRGRRGDDQPAQRPQRRAGPAPLGTWRAAGNDRRHQPRSGRASAQGIRPERRGLLPGRRLGQPGALCQDHRTGRTPRPAVPAVHPQPARLPAEGRPVQRDCRWRRAAAPPLRILQSGEGLPAQRRTRSAGGVHQADHLSHRCRLGADGIADGSRPRRQGSHRRAGADGPLRRRDQHQLGRQAGRSGRARGLRRGRPQDPCQAGPGAATRGRRAASLCPPGHRQLPPAYGAPVRGLRALHRRRGNLCRRP